jgi:hypothetical protein
MLDVEGIRGLRRWVAQHPLRDNMADREAGSMHDVIRVYVSLASESVFVCVVIEHGGDVDTGNVA